MENECNNLKLPPLSRGRKFTLSTADRRESTLDQFGLAAPVRAEDIHEQAETESGSTTDNQFATDLKGTKARRAFGRLVNSAPQNEDDIPEPPLKQERSLSVWERMRSSGEKGPDGKLIPKKRFKTLARMIKTNVAWTKDHSEKHDDENSQAFVVNAKDQTLIFDKDLFKAKHRTYGGLSNRARRILAKAPVERTDDELLILKDVVDRLKCFDKYPRKVKQELARVIYYEMFDQGRVIIQQGHVGQSFYFIVSGSVQVRITDIDKETGLRKQQIMGSLNEGSSFGELALMHNIKRTATVVCKEDKSEFLRVDKQDFEAVLRVSHEREMNERLRILKNLQTTRDWSLSQLTQLNNHCKLKEFAANKVIYGNTTLVPDMIYFVVSGQCRIVRELYVVRVIHEYGQQSFHLPTQRDLQSVQLTRRRGATKGKTHMIERHLWTIGTIGKGHFFGLGEDMTDTYIVTQNRVECLFVPRVQFTRSGHSRVLEQMREDIDSAIPDNTKLFELYFSECNWDKYKQGIVKDLVRRRQRHTNTTWEDVPYVIRMDSMRSLGNDKGYMDMTIRK